MTEQTPLEQEKIMQLIEEHGTPLYVYDLEKVKHNFSRLDKAISYNPHGIFYAVMANDNSQVLKTIKELGGGVQVNSFHELDIIYQVLFPNERISFTSTGLDTWQLSYIISEEMQVNLDSVEEVNKFCSGVDFSPKSKKFGIRLQMPNVYFNGRFSESDTGISESDLELVKVNARNRGVKINGVHGYSGSNIFDPEFLKRSADYIARCAREFPGLEYVNFGGGFGVPDNFTQKPLNLEEVLGYYSELTAKLSRDLGRQVELRIEPGRALVANAGTLYTRVTNVKRVNTKDPEGKDQISVDCGFGEFARPRLYGVFHEIFALGKEGNTRYCDVRGNTVLQDDYLTIDSSLPEVHEGDILGIRNVGAYGRVMASGFPGKELPREVCV